MKVKSAQTELPKQASCNTFLYLAIRGDMASSPQAQSRSCSSKPTCFFPFQLPSSLDSDVAGVCSLVRACSTACCFFYDVLCLGLVALFSLQDLSDCRPQYRNKQQRRAERSFQNPYWLNRTSSSPSFLKGITPCRALHSPISGILRHSDYGHCHRFSFQTSF